MWIAVCVILLMRKTPARFEQIHYRVVGFALPMPRKDRLADQRRRQNRVARHAAGLLRWEILHRDARRGQGVEAGDGDFALRQRHEAVGDAPPHILARLRREVAVERLDSAGKPRAVMCCVEALDAKSGRHPTR